MVRHHIALGQWFAEQVLIALTLKIHTSHAVTCLLLQVWC
jgi:hypothetical protein